MKTALAVVPAAVILLAGCASGSGADTPSASGAQAVGNTTTDPETTSDTTTSSAPSTTTSATVADLPTAFPTEFLALNQTITDPDLKDSIAVKRLARNLPWPAGYKASAQAYELVGVEMTWTPSADYTIPIRKQDFAINTGSQFPNAAERLVDDAAKAAGWALLPDSIDKGDPVTGWLIFKVDPKNPPKMVLDYTRPAVQISGSQTSFPAKTLSAGLVASG